MAFLELSRMEESDLKRKGMLTPVKMGQIHQYELE